MVSKNDCAAVMPSTLALLLGKRCIDFHVRYERSIQIREDMRDVNKLMMESVQTHVIMGRIILGVCWNRCIEGFPPEEVGLMGPDTAVMLSTHVEPCLFSLIMEDGAWPGSSII